MTTVVEQSEAQPKVGASLKPALHLKWLTILNHGVRVDNE